MMVQDTSPADRDQVQTVFAQARAPVTCGTEGREWFSPQLIIRTVIGKFFIPGSRKDY